jgi:hypothetical protein
MKGQDIKSSSAQPDGFVFHTEKGMPLTNKVLNRVSHPASTAALPRVSWHNCFDAVLTVAMSGESHPSRRLC